MFNRSPCSTGRPRRAGTRRAFHSSIPAVASTRKSDFPNRRDASAARRRQEGGARSRAALKNRARNKNKSRARGRMQERKARSRIRAYESGRSGECHARRSARHPSSPPSSGKSLAAGYASPTESSAHCKRSEATPSCHRSTSLRATSWRASRRTRSRSSARGRRSWAPPSGSSSFGSSTSTSWRATSTDAPGEEHGSSRWGTKADIKPFVNKTFSQNIILAQDVYMNIDERVPTENESGQERLHHRGGSGTGKDPAPRETQPHADALLLRHHRPEGHALRRDARDVRAATATRCAPSTRWTCPAPAASTRFHTSPARRTSWRSSTASSRTRRARGEKSSEDFWVKSERLLYNAVIAYLFDWYGYDNSQRIIPTSRCRGSWSFSATGVRLGRGRELRERAGRAVQHAGGRSAASASACASTRSSSRQPARR